MKTMILSAFSLLMFDHAVIAKEYINPADQLTIGFVRSMIGDEKTPLKVEELPEGVKKTLAGDAYQGWAAKEAYLVKTTDKPEYYQVVVFKKDAESKTINFSKEGTVIE